MPIPGAWRCRSDKITAHFIFLLWGEHLSITVIEPRFYEVIFASLKDTF